MCSQSSCGAGLGKGAEMWDQCQHSLAALSFLPSDGVEVLKLQ
jgi:hypothetical protein